jgi:hypothetical protein
MENERPVWKTVLSIFGILFLVIRLVYTCSKMNDRKSNDLNINNVINDNLIEQHQYQDNIQRALLKKNNDLLYTKYQNLDTINDAQKQLYSVIKLAKDSLVTFDLSTKIKIEKNYYFQNNHDDSLRMAFKSPKDLNVFIHDFESKESEETNFKNLKKNANLKHFKLDNLLTETKTFSYTITKNKITFNGYALSFKNNGYQTFIEFESQKISGLELKFAALSFLNTNLKQSKKSTVKN